PGRLRVEAGPLIYGIGKLGEGVGVLAAEDDELEPLHEPRIVLARACQRRDLDRVIDHKRGLAQAWLDMLLEKIVELLPRRTPARVFEHQVGHALAAVGWREVDGFALVRG